MIESEEKLKQIELAKNIFTLVKTDSTRLNLNPKRVDEVMQLVKQIWDVAMLSSTDPVFTAGEMIGLAKDIEEGEK